MAIMIYDDGVWCTKCRKFHPTLFWHKPYEEYATWKHEDEIWEETRKRFHLTDEQVDECRSENLRHRSFRETDTLGNCVVCGAETHFVSKKTSNYVCRDQCLYEDNHACVLMRRKKVFNKAGTEHSTEEYNSPTAEEIREQMHRAEEIVNAHPILDKSPFDIHMRGEDIETYLQDWPEEEQIFYREYYEDEL